MTDDYLASVNTDGNILIGERINGLLETSGDIDWIRLYLDKDTTYTFAAFGQDRLDLEMYLRDRNGYSLEYNDDKDDDSTDPSITYKALYSGNYYLDIGDFWYGTGGYEVTFNSLSVAGSTPTYLLTPSASKINEGESLNTVVSTSNVSAGSTLYWAAYSNNMSGEDFSVDSPLYGSFQIDSDGKFTISQSIKSDNLTEGNESFRLKLFSDSLFSNLLTESISIEVVDSSKGLPTYSITSSSYKVKEGESFSIDVSTTNINEGTKLYWSLSGLNINPSDFQSDSLKGSGLINKEGTFSFSHKVANDLTTEGTETIIINLFSDSSYTNKVAQSINIVVDDTSFKDDYSSDIQTTASFSINSPGLGNIESTGDIDWWKIYLTKDNTYQFDVFDINLSLDLDMYLRDGSGNQISYDDDSGLDNTPRIIYTPSTSGFYYLDIADYFLDATGQYRVEADIINIDDYSSNINTKGSVDLSNQTLAKIDFNSDKDWFRTSFQKGHIYQIDCKKISSIDPYIYLLDKDGNIIEYDDDSGSGDDAQLIFTSGYSGDYFFEIGDYGDDGIGEYSISAISLTAIDDYGQDIYTNGSINIDTNLSAKLDFKSDKDWFKVQLNKDNLYQFDCTELNSIDPFINLRDSQGNIIAYDDDSGSGDDAQLLYKATYTGSYFIDINDFDDNYTGIYNLAVKSLTTNDDYRQDTSTEGTINIGSTISAKLDFKTDEDWFKVQLEKDYLYQFDCTESNSIDPFINLRDSQGNIIAYDDNSGSGDDAQLLYKAIYTGTYFIDINDVGDNNTGTYNLDVKSLTAKDDYGQDISTKGNIDIGSTISAKIDFKSDKDWFNVSLIKGHTYQFDCTESNSIDPYINLRDLQGKSISTDDNGGSGDDAKLVFTASYTGNYFLDIKDVGDDNAGTYNLAAKSLTSNDDYGQNISTKGKIDIGTTINAKIDFKSDYDWFSVLLSEGNTYQFDCVTSDTIDPFIYLRDSDGIFLAYDDDSGNGSNARLEYKSSKTGLYFLDISDFNDSTIGEYQIFSKVVSSLDDFSNDIFTKGTLLIGGKKSGRLESKTDRDWLRVSLEKDITYQFDVIGTGLINTDLYIRNNNGDSLNYDNDSGIGNNASIVFTPQSSQTYFLDIGDYSNQNIGSYDISAKKVLNTTNDDYSEDVNTTGKAILNAYISGKIDFLGDKDWFSISVEQGKRYQFNCTELDELDPYIHLRNENGASISYDDNSGNGDDPKIIFDATSSNTIYVEVGDVSGNYLGEYKLYAQELSTSSTGFSSTNGYGSISAEKSFEKLLNIDLLSRPDDKGNLWGLDNIGAKEVWMGTDTFTGATGSGVTIAVIDTGIDSDHSEFKGRIYKPWDFVENNSDAEDDMGHGTHVAGTIAAANDNLGITGVAYNAKIMPLDVFHTYIDDQGKKQWSAYSYRTAAAIRYAVDNGADVINMSLGGATPSSQIYSALQYAEQNNVICVMASGNEYQSRPGYPARFAEDYGVAVGAENIQKTITAFTNKAGSKNLNYVTAPGENIYSTWLNNSYSLSSGTSMASPHVAGIAGLLKSHDKNLSPSQIMNLFIESASNKDLANSSSFSSVDTTKSANSTILPESILIEGTIVSDNILGTDKDEKIISSSGDDFINGSGGYDEIDCGIGIDTVIYNGKFKDYTIVKNVSSITSDNAIKSEIKISDIRKNPVDGFDNVINAEFFRFTDQTVEESKIDVVITYSGKFSDYKFYSNGNGVYHIQTEDSGFNDITGYPLLRFTGEAETSSFRDISAIVDVKGTFDQVT